MSKHCHNNISVHAGTDVLLDNKEHAQRLSSHMWNSECSKQSLLPGCSAPLIGVVSSERLE